MKKLAAASLALAVLVSTAVISAPMSLDVDPETPRISGSQSKSKKAADNAQIAGLANGEWNRSPTDASINRFVVALASAR